MTKKIEYAKKNLDVIAEENGFKTFISENNLYIEFRNGRNVKISDDEVMYQATEYLKNEIELLKF